MLGSQRSGLTVEQCQVFTSAVNSLPPPSAHNTGNNNHDNINLNKRGLRDNAGNSTFSD